jgi:uncharacterized protein YjbI with pentapeptide repeats
LKSRGSSVVAKSTDYPGRENEKPLDRNFALSLLNSADSDLSFEGRNLSGADLSNLNLENANFQHTNLSHVNFRYSNLRNADLRYALCHKTNFLESHLQNARLYGSELGNARLSVSSIQNKTTGFWAIGEHNLALVTDAIKEYHGAREVYLILSNRFRELGKFEASRELRVEALRAHRATRNPIRRYREAKASGYHLGTRRFLSFGLQWFSSAAADILSVYGESITRVLFLIITLIFGLGPLTISLLGGLDWCEMELQGLTLLVRPTGSLTYTEVVFHYLIYMIDIFTTSEFGILTPSNTAVRFASGMFAMIGIFMIGLLGFVVGNRFHNS